MQQLTEAAHRLRAGELAPALAALLAAWRTQRHPRIAELIDVVSDRVAPTAPLPGKTVSARDDAWRALARGKQPAELGRLLRTPWPKLWRGARPLLDLLNRWPDDPRIARVLARTIAEPPYDSLASRAFYELVVDKLGRVADVRGLPDLHAAIARGQPSFLPELARRAIAAIERRFPSGVPPLAPELEAALREAEAPLAGEVAGEAAEGARGADLLAAIYADPEDDDARAVYGDWLVERGDPRGELIALQLARARGEGAAGPAREAKLLEAHGRAWAHPLGLLFDAATHVFDRGFFAGGTLRHLAPELLGDPAWRLLRELEFFVDEARVLVDRPELHHLRSLGVKAEVAAAVAGGPAPRRLTHLACSLTVHDPELLAILARCPALPELRELAIWCNDAASSAGWLTAAPVVDRIDRLVIGSLRGYPELAAALATRPSALRRLSLGYQAWTAELQRESPASPFTTCTLTCGRYGPVVQHAITALAHVPAVGLRRLAIELGDHAFGPESTAQLEAELARRFAGVELALPW